MRGVGTVLKRLGWENEDLHNDLQGVYGNYQSFTVSQLPTVRPLCYMTLKMPQDLPQTLHR